MAKKVHTSLHGREIGLADDGSLVVRAGVIRGNDGSAVSFPDGIDAQFTGGTQSFGTITAGVWHGTAISPQYGGTGLSYALPAGAMLRGSGGDPLFEVEAGSNHQILTVSETNSGMPTFENPRIPQVTKNVDYTFVLSDGGKHFLHPSSDASTRTWTIPANSSVAFPVGTTLTLINQNGAGTLTISITTDTMRLAGAGTTGSRTLTANGMATAIKIASTEWMINGPGLT